MYNLENQYISPDKIRWIGRHLAADIDVGLLTPGEYDAIMNALRNLSKHGFPIFPERPRLLKVEEVASMLAISKSQFRAMEAEGKFPFKRKMVGASVRYLNIDVFRYMSSNLDTPEVDDENKK